MKASQNKEPTARLNRMGYESLGLLPLGVTKLGCVQYEALRLLLLCVRSLGFVNYGTLSLLPLSVTVFGHVKYRTLRFKITPIKCDKLRTCIIQITKVISIRRELKPLYTKVCCPDPKGAGGSQSGRVLAPAARIIWGVASKRSWGRGEEEVMTEGMKEEDALREGTKKMNGQWG